MENHPPKEIRKVLLLPGLFGTEFLYHRMLKDPEAEKKGLHLIVGLAPGTGGQKAPASFNFSIPSYAELVETLAVEEKIDLIVGQGFMTEVLIEVALRKKFQGNFVLLTPALEPDDEPLAIRKLDLLSRNSRFKDLLWLGSNSFIENMLESYSPLQPEEQERLVSEARRSSMNDSQKILHGYFNQLRNPLRSILHLIPSLPEGKISLVFAGNDSTKLKPENRSLLLHSRKMKLIHLPRSSHWVTLDEWKTLNRILWP